MLLSDQASSALRTKPSSARRTAGRTRSRQGSRPKQLISQGHAANRSRYADRFGTVDAFVLGEHGLAGGGRCRFAIFDDQGLEAGAWRDDHEAAAADVARGRIGHGQGEFGGDGGVNGIASLEKNISTHVGGRRRDRHHHAVAFLVRSALSGGRRYGQRQQDQAANPCGQGGGENGRCTCHERVPRGPYGDRSTWGMNRSR